MYAMEVVFPAEQRIPGLVHEPQEGAQLCLGGRKLIDPRQVPAALGGEDHLQEPPDGG
jgi:hypothetical protein